MVYLEKNEIEFLLSVLQRSERVPPGPFALRDHPESLSISEKLKVELEERIADENIHEEFFCDFCGIDFRDSIRHYDDCRRWQWEGDKPCGLQIPGVAPFCKYCGMDLRKKPHEKGCHLEDK